MPLGTYIVVSWIVAGKNESIRYETPSKLTMQTAPLTDSHGYLNYTSPQLCQDPSGWYLHGNFILWWLMVAYSLCEIIQAGATEFL